jgi:hypothetical protein
MLLNEETSIGEVISEQARKELGYNPDIDFEATLKEAVLWAGMRREGGRREEGEGERRPAWGGYNPDIVPAYMI